MQNENHKPSIFAIATFAVLLTSVVASSAEIQLRRECHASSHVVRLGDVADIYTTDAQEKNRLASVELFVAPAERTSRRVTARDIQDALALRGVAMGKHRFSGAATVKVHARMSGRSARGVRLSSSVVATSRRKVSDAIVAYLQQTVEASDPWQVDVELPADQTQLIATSSGRLQVSGGTRPWVGRQRFIVRIGAVDLPITVQVTLPPMTVVAVRAIGRGEVIRASDVALKSLKPRHSALAVLHDLKDVIGKEAIRPIAAGQVVPDRNIRSPLLVRRGDIVTVYVYSGGVRVRTTARARQQGSLGETVEVESLVKREKRRYLARVASTQTVEVFAKSMSVRPVESP